MKKAFVIGGEGEASVYQTYRVFAENADEAFAAILRGEGECIDENIDIIEISFVREDLEEE